MTTKEELELILDLMRKYNLPLSPILEYAIKEKIEEYPNDEQPNTIDDDEITGNNSIAQDKQQTSKMPVEITSNELRIVDYGERTIAVIGDTKSHKDVLKALGGYFILRTQWGPAWIFRTKKREKIQAYLDGDITEDSLLEEKNQKEEDKKYHTRYIIRVKYPNGREFCSKLVWETLVDVVIYASPESVRRLGITCMGDNLVSTKLNDNPLYRSAQKEIGDGLYVCTYSSTDVKYNQIRRINRELKLGLIVEKIYIDENGDSTPKKEDEPYRWDELKSGSRDRTRYSFEGGELLSKRRFVLEVVKYYVRCHPRISYESLIRVFPATLNSNKSNGVIKRYNDVAKQVALNPDVRNRFFMKGDEVITLFNGMKVVVHNQWGDDFDRFLKVAESLYTVKSSNESYVQSVSPAFDKDKGKQLANSVESKEDKRIGYTVRLFPSQLKGEIVRVRVDMKGIKKLVVKIFNGNVVEVNDLPYLYEVLKRG